MKVEGALPNPSGAKDTKSTYSQSCILFALSSGGTRRRRMKQTIKIRCELLLLLSLFISSSLAFQSDELLIEEEELGSEGGFPDLAHIRSSPPPTRKRYSESDQDSKIQFSLEHAFGDSDFSPAGIFNARLKTWNHGAQVSFLSLSCYYLLLLLHAGLGLTWSFITL